MTQPSNRWPVLFVPIAVALLCLCWSRCVGAKGTDSILRDRTLGRYAVTSIEFNFVGKHKYKDKTLRAKLGFKQGDDIDTYLAEAYRRTFVEFYRKKGFHFVEVTLDTEQLPDGSVIYTISEGPRVKIASVKFSGNNAIRTGRLKGAVKTKTTQWLIQPKYYLQEQVAEDVMKLQNIYYERGFLDVNIAAEAPVGLRFSEDRSKVHITFTIDEGPAYTVGKIIFIGNEHFYEDRLRAELKLKQGQIYNRRTVESDVEQLLKLYHENGFIDVKIPLPAPTYVSEVGVSVVNVEVEIFEGQHFRIGRIDIIGNVQTQDKVIRRVLDEYDFQPGRWYNADIARGDGTGYLEKLIRQTAYTESATITPIGEVPGQKDAQVSIVEAQTGIVMAGAGVSSDMGLIGQLVFQQRNFDASDWPESFSEFITGQAFKGAGQDFRIAVQPGTEVSEYSISFTEPYLQDKPITLDVLGLSRVWERESYDEGRTKGYVGFEKRYKNRWRRSIGFRAENVDVDNLGPNTPSEITAVKGDNAFAGVKFGIGRDLTDDRFNPSKGHNFNVGYEQLAGDHTFGILSGVYRWYETLHEDLAERRTILATKLLGATVLGDAPPFERFYAGGTGTYGLRGFDYRGVSTRGLNPVTLKRQDPIGSDWVFLANAEVTVPLVGEEIAALFFVDSGTIDTGRWRAAVGTGIQIRLPWLTGPVPMRFEFATPVMKDDEDDVRVFSFSMGRLF